MQERSTDLDKWLTAYFDVVNSIGDIPKSGYNPHFGNHHSTLNDVFEALQKPLKDNFMTVLQTVTTLPHVQPGFAVDAVPLPALCTTIMHVPSGQWVSDRMLLGAAAATTAQNQGSGITYARRYALVTMFGLTSEIDDDGNAASQPTKASNSKAIIAWTELIDHAKQNGFSGDHVKEYLAAERKSGKSDKDIFDAGFEHFKRGKQ